jgi:hypothetical protein
MSMHIHDPRAGRRRRRLLVAATALAVLAGTVTAVAGPAAPAFASLPGLFSQAARSAYDSDQSKTAVATCPANNSLVGMGANLFGGGGDVSIEQIMPDIATRSVTVTAKETDPYTGSWEIWAWAMCVPNPAPAGLVVRTSASPSDSSDKTLTASCGPTETLLAIGYDVGNGFGEVLVTQVRPDGGAGIAATSATISAYEDDVYTASWTLTAYLLCATPIAGQQVVTAANTPSLTAPVAPVTATCPAGQNATGGSVAVEPTLPGIPNDFSVYEVLPVGLPVGPIDAVQVIISPEDPVSYPWSERAFALCV